MKHYVNSHPLTPESSCCCGRKALFGECCGSSAADREPPRQLTVVRDFLSVAERKQLLRYAEKQKRKWLTIIDVEKSTPSKNVEIRDPARVTQTVNMSKRQDRLDDIVRKALIEEVGASYGFKPASFEPPYILRYRAGGKYGIHADGEEYDEEAQRWYRIRDRDVSLLIYLNDDYEGGGLKFNYLNYTYQPSAGDLVYFPSSHIYCHESLPVKSGVKWALVSWSCFAHTRKVGIDQGNWKTLPV